MPERKLTKTLVQILQHIAAKHDAARRSAHVLHPPFPSSAWETDGIIIKSIFLNNTFSSTNSVSPCSASRRKNFNASSSSLNPDFSGASSDKFEEARCTRSSAAPISQR